MAWRFSFPNKSQSRLVRTGEETGDWTWEYACWGTMSRLALTWECEKLDYGIMHEFQEYMTKRVVPYRTNAFPGGWEGDCAAALVLFEDSARHGVIWYCDSFSFSYNIQVSVIHLPSITSQQQFYTSSSLKYIKIRTNVTHLSNNKFFLQMLKQNLQDENERLPKSSNKQVIRKVN